MHEIILQADDLAVGYGGKAVLKGLSFSLRPGEILTLIGPNGAGKSTILKTLARRLEPVAGTVLLDRETLSRMAENELARRLSVVTTERLRAELMSCAEVVATGRYPYTGRLGILSEHDRAATRQAMALVRVSELAGQSFEELSDGQRQRVMLARAICQEPELLLLDEPTSFLDVRYKVEFLTMLKELAREKQIAVVLSLHELDCAERVSDTVLCVRDGAVDRVGRPEEIFTPAYIEQLYGMEPGSYNAFFGDVKPDVQGDQRFFQNRGCPFFPCHRGVEEQDFNCLFCYCPLYALGDRCGGNFRYTDSGVKSCEDCPFPHRRENYERVLSRWPEIAALTKRKEEGASGLPGIRSGAKMLRCGYTTGTCAALAAAGAARLLLTGEAPERAHLTTPKGWTVEVPLKEAVLDVGEARCAVRKDAGDDPDVTDGCLVCAAVSRTEPETAQAAGADTGPGGIRIDGGEGVGRVTKPGLDQPVGAAAINAVPRRMIADAVKEVCDELGYDGSLSVVISVPGGAEIARRTFNPVLGIEGGISILGTSGIVEPMSEQALIDTVELALRQAAALDTGCRGEKRLILTPGSYGEKYLHAVGLDALGVPVVKCSNFIGEALDAAAVQGFSEVLLVGHVGKLVKLAGGVMNTHSAQADCRAELFTAHAALCGANGVLCRALMEAVTADACLKLLADAGLREKVLASLLTAIQTHLDRRAAGRMKVGAAIFSNEYGSLGETAEAGRMRKEWA